MPVTDFTTTDGEIVSLHTTGQSPLDLLSNALGSWEAPDAPPTPPESGGIWDINIIIIEGKE